MMIMTKSEANEASRVWAANVKAPIDRDTQIYMMKTAQQRHKDNINKFMKQLEERKKEHDPLG